MDRNHDVETVAPAHHARGMSKWPAILECPYFEGKGESRDAAMGTAVHGSFAGFVEALKRGEGMPDAEGLSLHEAGALRAARLVFDEAMAREVPADEIFTERRVELEDGVFGTCDAYFADRWEKIVHVYDFKTFFNPGRDYSAQVVGYGLAILDGMEGESDFCREDWDIQGAILYGDSPETYRMRSVEYGEALAIYGDVKQAFMEREGGYGRPRQCNWCELCAKFGGCQACEKAVVSLPEVDVLPADVRRGFGTVREWDALEPASKAQLLVLAEFAGKWADAVRARAKADAMAGVVLSDEANGIAFRLRESRGRARPRVNELWPLMVAHKVSAEAFRERLSISASDAERLLRDAGMRAREAKEAVLAVSDVGAGSVSLVRC